MSVNCQYTINCKTNLKVFNEREKKKSITVIKNNVKKIFTVVQVKVKLEGIFIDTILKD